MRDSARIAVVGGGLAGLEAAVAAVDGGAAVEVFEPGPHTRTRHVNWDTAVHAGDEKVRSWTSDGWSDGGGLSERLGGRSLCYHGVLIGLEPAALAHWGSAWSGKLMGDEGLYASILHGLQRDFPALKSEAPCPGLDAQGLRHVPQAACVDVHGRFEAYSPLARALELVVEGRIKITRARVHAVASAKAGCVLELERSPELRGGFDSCVLASSAIGNVQILAASLRRDITTTVTDHLCVGAFMRLPPGPPLAPFRHEMFWSGFATLEKMGANVFVLERPPLPCGDRIVQVQGVVEQQDAPSELTVDVMPSGVRSHIRAHVSNADRARLDAVRLEIRQRAERLAGGALVEVSSPSSSALRKEASWLSHDDALASVTAADAAGVFCQYEVGYGAFEHEACTHPIGDAAPAPVSPELEVVELPGVYVVGPGAFPRLGAANPALTIIALSRWLGARLSC